jgi:hypothetical protein
MYRPRARRAWMLAAAVLATSCYQSQTPLDPTPQVAVDARLLGVWRCVGPDPSDDAITIRVAAAGSRSYAVTWEESGKAAADHYEAYASAITGSTFLNVRETPVRSDTLWSLVRVTLLQPTVALVQMVHEDLLKGQGTAAVRRTIEAQLNNPGLYEKAPLACIRGAN